jgi:hypothetical protein
MLIIELITFDKINILLITIEEFNYL